MSGYLQVPVGAFETYHLDLQSRCVLRSKTLRPPRSRLSLHLLPTFYRWRQAARGGHVLLLSCVVNIVHKCVLGTQVQIFLCYWDWQSCARLLIELGTRKLDSLTTKKVQTLQWSVAFAIHLCFLTPPDEPVQVGNKTIWQYNDAVLHGHFCRTCMPVPSLLRMTCALKGAAKEKQARLSFVD